MLTLQKSSLDWALAHAVELGDTDLFPLPFEYEALQHDWSRVRSQLEQKNVLKWNVRPHRTLLSAKSRTGFRAITQLDPLDFVIFAASLREIGSDLESYRVPIADRVVFSYRFAPQSDGHMFDKTIGYRQFLEEAERLLDERPGPTHVAVTDIADFYHRIYHHRLENALEAATSKRSHVKAIVRFLSGWNATETFGIPVGSAPSRLLAETTIANVDEALLARGIPFIRYNDDYRFFANSYAEAYRHLALLADTLFRTHGLNLQPQKTEILEAEVFRQRYLPGPEEREFTSLQEKFRELVSELGLANEYGDIEYDDLEPDHQELIGSLNLAQLLRDELDGSGEPDVQVLRFVLRRLGQLGDASLVDEVFQRLDFLHHVFPDVIRYVRSLRDLSSSDCADIGGKVVVLLKDSIISELDYHRMWALDLFTRSTKWDSEGEFMRLFVEARVDHSKRKLILAMGRAGQRHWFQSQWRSLFDYPPWTRRALLAAGSCLSSDARKHWYKSVEPRLDLLETAVMRWARQHPFA